MRLPFTDDRVSALQRFPTFAQVPRRELADLVHDASETSVPAGWALIAEQTPADSAYVILTGTAHVQRDGQRVADLGPGDVVGEMALVSHALRNATVVADSALELLRLGADRFARLLERDPGLRAALTARMRPAAAPD